MRKYQGFEKYKKKSKGKLTITIDKEIIEELKKIENLNVSLFINDILKKEIAENIGEKKSKC